MERDAGVGGRQTASSVKRWSEVSESNGPAIFVAFERGRVIELPAISGSGLALAGVSVSAAAGQAPSLASVVI